jgi:hypothetical protein
VGQEAENGVLERHAERSLPGRALASYRNVAIRGAACHARSDVKHPRQTGEVWPTPAAAMCVSGGR